MDPKAIAIIGAGIIGAGALIIMNRSQPGEQPAGTFGGSKKEDAQEPIYTETITETVYPGGDGALSVGGGGYNIYIPPPPPITWPEIPDIPTTKKARKTRPIVEKLEALQPTKYRTPSDIKKTKKAVALLPTMLPPAQKLKYLIGG